MTGAEKPQDFLQRKKVLGYLHFNLGQLGPFSSREKFTFLGLGLFERAKSKRRHFSGLLG